MNALIFRWSPKRRTVMRMRMAYLHMHVMCYHLVCSTWSSPMPLGKMMVSALFVVGGIYYWYLKLLAVPTTQWKHLPCWHNTTSYSLRGCERSYSGAATWTCIDDQEKIFLVTSTTNIWTENTRGQSVVWEPTLQRMQLNVLDGLYDWAQGF